MSSVGHDEPTSTTKALLVMIVAPRLVAAEKKEPTENEKDAAKDAVGIKEESKANDKEVKADVKLNNPTSVNEKEVEIDNHEKKGDSSKINGTKTSAEVGNVDNNDEKKTTQVSNQMDLKPMDSEIPAFSSDHDAKTPARSNKKGFSIATERNEIDASERKNTKSDSMEDEASVTSTAKSIASNSLPECNKDVSEEVTPEEAAQVVVSNEDPGVAEVNVEALLRLTMKGLLEEWHLLTVPTISRTNQNWFTSTGNEKQSIEDENKCIQVQFMAKPTSLAVILDRLERIGIGTNCGNVSVYQAELCRSTSSYAHKPVEESTSLPSGPPSISRQHDLAEENEENLSRITVGERMIEDAKIEWKNAATRLRIEQVREQIAEQQAWTFDFQALLVIASILAGIGLITNSVTVIVASMLVSPIMGPVLGLTFGSQIRDWPLVKSSLRNELMALMICVVIGLLAGVIASFTSIAEEWPTEEMESRGEIKGLIIGIAIAIAIPSGMGVCLSMLGGNTSSLVGVAISASLLPPAVNAGLCLVYSLLLSTGAVAENENKSASDFAMIGGISFLLTVVNIICIWFSGLIMFEIKEVTKFEKKAAFWANDLKVARELNRRGSNEKPAPVNIEIIRKGLESAAKHRPYHSERFITATTNTSDRIERLCSSERDATQYASGRPPLTSIHVSSMRSLQQTPAYGNAGRLDDVFPLESNPSVDQQEGGFMKMLGSVLNGWGRNDDEEDDEDDGDDVGLDDMGKLLGFNESEDRNMDHERIAQNIGKGRYI